MDFIKLVIKQYNDSAQLSKIAEASSFWDGVANLWQSLKIFILGILDRLGIFFIQLGQDLKSRMLVLVEELRPIWQDPLWQFVLVVFATIILILLSWWLLTKGKQLSIIVFSFIWKSIKWLAKLVVIPFLWLYHKMKGKKPELWQSSDRFLEHYLQLKKGLEALKYLTTQRDWRYKMPWYLLIGENDSGKNTFINAVKEGRRAQLLLREKQLQTKQSHWHFFDHGVVITSNSQNETDNSWLMKAEQSLSPANKKADKSNGSVNDKLIIENSDADEQLLNQPQQATLIQSEINKQEVSKSFQYLLQLLHLYRPERPVDGVILTVSIGTLIRAKTPAEQQQLGNQLYQQLWMLQKQTGYVTPVYFIVTRCDELTGFRSFWRAQPKERYREMLGWSNPNRLDIAFNDEWVDEAFVEINDNLQDAQLQAAASGEDIQDIDNFMLFHRYFQNLKKPLKEVIASAFARSRYQEPLPIRGIYFCGKVEQEVAFVESLMSQKIFAEKNLAWPLEKRVFSTQKTLRRFQFSMVTLGVIFLISLAIDSVRLSHHVTQNERVLGQLIPEQKEKVSDLRNQNTKCSAQGLENYRLLAHLSEIGERRFYFSMPLSWFDTYFVKEQKKVARKILSPFLFTTLECRLKAKAEQINSYVWPDNTSASYPVVIEQLNQYSQMVEDFNTSRNDFLYLAGPLENDHKVSAKLKKLLQYLYDTPMPDSVNLDSPMITGAVQVMDYDVNWSGKQSNLVAHSDILSGLIDIANELHTQLIFHASHPPLKKIQSVISHSKKIPASQTLIAHPLIPEISSFQQWLSLIEQDWLQKNVTNPCRKIHQQLQELKVSLLETGYPLKQILPIIKPFEKQNCDDVVYAEMAQLVEYPIGKLFVENGPGQLSIAPSLVNIRTQLELLSSLSFLRGSYPPIIQSSDQVVGWRTAPIRDALKVLVEFQKFTLSHWQKEKPFYAPMLQQRLSEVVNRLINQAQIYKFQQTDINLSGRFDAESELSQQVNDFMEVQNNLIRVENLLSQLGDNYNRINLRQASRTFVRSKFKQLDSLVVENKIYQSALSPDWSNNSYSRAIFDYQSDKQLDDYLSGQRQRLSYLTYNYAEPLLSYLLNSGGVDTASKNSNRWFATLTALNQYQREEPGNQILSLESFINDKLVELTDLNCQQWLVDREKKLGTNSRIGFGSSWFGERHYQLDKLVRFQCQGFGKHQVVGRYLEIADRFNRDLAGRFPFADIANAGEYEVSPMQMKKFFRYYSQRKQNLSSQLEDLSQSRPGLISESWKSFISQLDNIEQMLAKAVDSDQLKWSLPLDVQFHAQPELSTGADQIISWHLSNDHQTISFPNGGNKLDWKVGVPLSLKLRWATGSAYQPLKLITQSSPLSVQLNNAEASFTSRGQWALFEWLSLFSSNREASASLRKQSEYLMSFEVPVGLRSEIAGKPHADYIASAFLKVSSSYVAKDGDLKRISIPVEFPRFAPGFRELSLND